MKSVVRKYPITFFTFICSNLLQVGFLLLQKQDC